MTETTTITPAVSTEDGTITIVIPTGLPAEFLARFAELEERARVLAPQVLAFAADAKEVVRRVEAGRFAQEASDDLFEFYHQAIGYDALGALVVDMRCALEPLV